MRRRLLLLAVLPLWACDGDEGDAGDDDAELRATVPFTDYCAAARGWNADWIEAETEALARIDAARVRGLPCGRLGRPGPAPQLRLDGRLTCAARRHALSMATTGFEGHVDPNDETDPQARADAAEYGADVVQHWAGGPRDARALVDVLWLPSEGHCADLLSREVVDVGIGHVGDIDGERGTYWVVVLGAGAPLP